MDGFVKSGHITAVYICGHFSTLMSVRLWLQLECSALCEGVV